MHDLISDFIFTKNGDVPIDQLNELYCLIGWDKTERRTFEETNEILQRSNYWIAAFDGLLLIGFVRICGEPYIVQVLDVITHPNYRRRGIARQCMQGIISHLQKSRYVSVTLTDGLEIPGFYDNSVFGL